MPPLEMTSSDPNVSTSSSLDSDDKKVTRAWPVASSSVGSASDIDEVCGIKFSSRQSSKVDSQSFKSEDGVEDNGGMAASSSRLKVKNRPRRAVTPRMVKKAGVTVSQEILMQVNQHEIDRRENPTTKQFLNYLNHRKRQRSRGTPSKSVKANYGTLISPHKQPSTEKRTPEEFPRTQALMDKAPKSHQASIDTDESNKDGFNVNSRVEGNWKGQGSWFPGTIFDVVKTGRTVSNRTKSVYSVMYDDGDCELRMPMNRLRILDYKTAGATVIKLTKRQRIRHESENTKFTDTPVVTHLGNNEDVVVDEQISQQDDEISEARVNDAEVDATLSELKVQRLRYKLEAAQDLIGLLAKSCGIPFVLNETPGDSIDKDNHLMALV